MSGLEPMNMRGGGVAKNNEDPRFLSREGFLSLRDDPERLNVRDITDFVFDPTDPLDIAAAGAAATGLGIPAALGMKGLSTARKVKKGLGTLGAMIPGTMVAREGIDILSGPIDYGKEILELVASAPDAGGVVGEIASSLAQYPKETVETIYQVVREESGYPIAEKANGGIMKLADGSDIGILPESAKTPTGKKKKAVVTVLDIMDEVAEKLPTKKAATAKPKPKKKTQAEKNREKMQAENQKKIQEAENKRLAEARKAESERVAASTKKSEEAINKADDVKKSTPKDFEGKGTGSPGKARRALEATGRMIGSTAKGLKNIGLYGLAGYGGLEIAKNMFGDDQKADGSSIANVSSGDNNTNVLLPENDPAQQDPNTLPQPGTTTTTTKNSLSTKTVGSGSPTPSPAPAPSSSGDEFDPKDIESSDKFAEIMKYNLITKKGFNVDETGNFVGQKPTFIDYLKTLPSTYIDKVGRDEDYAKKMMAGFLNMMKPVEGYVPINPVVAFGEGYLGEETRQADMESAMAKTLRFLDKYPEQKAAYIQTLKASSGIDPFKDIDPEKNIEAYNDLFLNKLRQYRITTDPKASANDFYLYDPVTKTPFDSTSLLNYQNSNPAVVPVVVSRLQLLKRNPG